MVKGKDKIILIGQKCVHKAEFTAASTALALSLLVGSMVCAKYSL